MKGAIIDPSERTINAESKNNTKKIGIIHHSFLFHINRKNSFIINFI